MKLGAICTLVVTGLYILKKVIIKKNNQEAAQNVTAEIKESLHDVKQKLDMIVTSTKGLDQLPIVLERLEKIEVEITSMKAKKKATKL